MKYSHFFTLGTHRGISWAEILEVFKLDAESTKRLDSFLLASLDNTARLDLLFNRLAGAVKMGEVISVASEASEVIKNIATYLKQEKFNPKAVVINVYHSKLSPRDIRMRIKERFGGTLKFLGDMKKPTYNSATTAKALRKEGIELSIFGDSEHIYVGRTLYVQDISLWSALDYEKPHRDMKIGMLPSKLARIMLNLAGLEPDDGFWDPFCGLGTLLMQGQFLDLYSYGSDIDVNALRMARENVEWLLKRGYVKGLKFRVFKYDIRKNPMSNKILRDIAGRGKFNAIVTEGYLGKPRPRPFSTKRQVLAQWIQVRPLYKVFLRHVSYLIDPGARVVFVVPRYRLKGKGWYAPKLEINFKRFKPVRFNTGPLIWQHSDSIVARELLVVEKRG